MTITATPHPTSSRYSPTRDAEEPWSSAPAAHSPMRTAQEEDPVGEDEEDDEEDEEDEDEDDYDEDEAEEDEEDEEEVEASTA